MLDTVLVAFAQGCSLSSSLGELQVDPYIQMVQA